MALYIEINNIILKIIAKSATIPNALYLIIMNNITKNKEGDGERAQTYEQQYIINSMRAAQMRISFNKSNTEEAKRETARATKDYFENYKTNAGLAKKIYGKTFSEVLDSDHSFCQYLNKELSIDR